jgi:SAM-dependent methyltransferase
MSTQPDSRFRGNSRLAAKTRRLLQICAAVFNKLELRLRPQVRLDGDRIIEWSFVAGSLPEGPGTALDFGPGHAWLGLIAVHRGFQVTEVDLRSLPKLYVEPSIQTLVGDLTEAGLDGGSFDVIINCSSVEHAGLAGRYGVEQNAADGDLNVMRRMRSLLKPDGQMLLTIPVGRDSVFAPLHRVYGEERLKLLLDGWRVCREEYWMKKADNRWHRVERSAATGMQPRFDLYALGCFVLRPE